jgi:hypothetical protein
MRRVISVLNGGSEIRDTPIAVISIPQLVMLWAAAGEAGAGGRTPPIEPL